MQLDAAGFGLVRDVGRLDFQYHRKAHRARSLHRIVGVIHQGARRHRDAVVREQLAGVGLAEDAGFEPAFGQQRRRLRDTAASRGLDLLHALLEPAVPAQRIERGRAGTKRRKAVGADVGQRAKVFLRRRDVRVEQHRQAAAFQQRLQFGSHARHPPFGREAHIDDDRVHFAGTRQGVDRAEHAPAPVIGAATVVSTGLPAEAYGGRYSMIRRWRLSLSVGSSSPCAESRSAAQPPAPPEVVTTAVRPPCISGISNRAAPTASISSASNTRITPWRSNTAS